MRVLNDDELLQALDGSGAVQLRSLGSHLNEVADYLALIGAADLAESVWGLVYSGQVPLEDSQVAFKNRALIAWQYYIGHAVVPLGERPELENADGWEEIRQAAMALDRKTRRQIAMDHWHPLAQMERIQAARRAVAVATPPPGERFSPTERDALPHLDAFFGMAGPGAQAVLDFHLLYADITLRNGLTQQAIEHFKAWYDGATALNCNPSVVFGMTTTAHLAFTGTLLDRLKLTPERRRDRVTAWLDETRRRIECPAPAKPAPPEVEAIVFYSTLTFGPANDAVWQDEWSVGFAETAPPIPDGDYPRVVSISTPSETGGCLIQPEFPPLLPSWEDADHVVAFPFRVLPNELAGTPQGRIGTVFPSTPTGQKKDAGLEIPPGEYDVLARFFFVEEDDASLRYWHVFLSFLERGAFRRESLRPGIVKSE